MRLFLMFQSKILIRVLITSSRSWYFWMEVFGEALLHGLSFPLLNQLLSIHVYLLASFVDGNFISSAKTTFSDSSPKYHVTGGNSPVSLNILNLAASLYILVLWKLIDTFSYSLILVLLSICLSSSSVNW